MSYFNIFMVILTEFSSVQSLSRVQLFVTPWTAAHQASLSTTNSQSLPKLMSIESALRLRWPKYWSFSFNISPSNEHPGLISFRMDCLDILAVQGTLNSLLQHHISKASILWPSLWSITHLYMTPGRLLVAESTKEDVSSFQYAV